MTNNGCSLFLFPSTPQTQTESISQTADILLTPLCEGTSPWRLLVGVGDRTHTVRARPAAQQRPSPKLTFSHRTSAQGETPALPPFLPLGLHSHKRPHILPHSLSCTLAHQHTRAHTRARSVNSPTQTLSQPEKSWKSS